MINGHSRRAAGLTAKKSGSDGDRLRAEGGLVIRSTHGDVTNCNCGAGYFATDSRQDSIVGELIEMNNRIR